MCIYIYIHRDRDYPKERMNISNIIIHVHIFLYEKFFTRLNLRWIARWHRVLTYDLVFDLLKQDSSLNVVITSANNSHIYLELTKLSLSLWLIIFLLITLTFRRCCIRYNICNSIIFLSFIISFIICDKIK